MHERRFLLPQNRGAIIFAPAVLEHMYQHAQVHFIKRKLGDSYSAQPLIMQKCLVTLATGPYPEDRRSRHAFKPTIVEPLPMPISNLPTIGM
jgi:hypothetical protein